MKKTLLTSLLIVLPILVIGQNTVTGTITDSQSGDPLLGANVVVKGTNLGAATNADGVYTINNVPTDGEQTIVANYIGYASSTQTINVSGTSTLDFALNRSAVGLDEVVVTGVAGENRKKALGNVIASLNVEDIVALAPRPDLTNLISATIPGVRIMDNGGEVGTGGTSRIRGVSSMTLAGTPILVVDGVRVNGQDNEARFGGVGYDYAQAPSRINDFNQEEIEKIEVLKGPAAATLYGTEASNGVISIITKKGQKGKAKINFTTKSGSNSLPKDPKEYFMPTYYTSTGVDGNAPGTIVEVNVIEEDAKQGLNWFQDGKITSYNLDVSGGGDNHTYYVAAGWNDENGIVNYNWKKGMNARANISLLPTPTLRLSFGLGTVQSRTEFSSAQQPLSTAIIWACPAPGCEPKSGLPNALDGPYRGYIAYLPEAYQNEIEGFQDLDRTTWNASATHDPFPWLNQRLIIGGDFGNTRSTELYKATGNLGNFGNNGRKTVLSSRANYTTIDYNVNATVQPKSWLSSISSVGVQFYEKRQQIVYGYGETFPVAALETISSGATKTADEEFLQNKTFGVYYQQQFGINDRIFLTAAVRGDDNSSFGKNYDFVVYPKYSLAYALSEEAFFRNALPWISEFKFRTAFGQAGRQPDLFAAIRTYAPAVGPGGSGTLTPNNIGNPDLEPEIGTETEIGFDAGFMNGFAGLEFTIFNQRTNNAIISVPVLPSTGFPGAQFRNIGEIKNNGIEIGANITPIRTRGVFLNFGMTYSTTKNEIISLGGQPPIVQSASQGQMNLEGFPLAGIFQRKVVSADLVTSAAGRTSATNAMCEGGDVVPGTNFSRGGGSPVPCGEAPAVYWGQPIPESEGSFYGTLTLNNNLTRKSDLTFYALVDWVAGNTMVSGDIAAQHRFFLNSKAMQERTDAVLLGYESLGGGGLWQPGIIDAGFGKLRTLAVSYKLPNTLVDKVPGISSANLNFSINNVATLWVDQEEGFGARQMDPEVSNQLGGATEGLNAYNQEGWGQLRTMLFTLRVSF
jgi:TonB-linked SusC/RagA family outer membrane protein